NFALGSTLSKPV
ncbi:hypothetical protein D046_6951B, partial [Vibrio parahaemolyticus V-223/04]